MNQKEIYFILALGSLRCTQEIDGCWEERSRMGEIMQIKWRNRIRDL